MRFEFRVLGEVEADLDGQPIDVGPARQQSVLAALVADANRPVQIDELIRRVWDDRPPQRARATLHTYLSRIRQAFAPVSVDICRSRGDTCLR